MGQSRTDAPIDAVQGSSAELHWFVNGGDWTLASYGVSSAAEVPLTHLAFLQQTRLSFDDGLRLFVHAGVNPDQSLSGQDGHDLLWIREPFLSSEKNFGRLILHGHSPLRSGRPDVHPNRVNLDTGAVYGGPLTAAAFFDDQDQPIRFIQAGEHAHRE
jgi:serine/threonine protein phosphatase 1